jgi:beta-fructofuranosidase
VGLAVRCSPDGEELTRITYSFQKDRLQLDCRKSSLDATTERPLTGGPLRLSRGSPLRLHIFLDGSTVEVFANGRTAATRIYPTRPDSVGIQLIGARRDSRLASLDVWEMQPIWDGTESIPEHP